MGRGSLKCKESSHGYTDVIEAYLIEMSRRRRANEAAGTFTITQLYHVLADMFGAGTDTALTTIKWIILYVILYPDVQVKTFFFYVSFVQLAKGGTALQLNDRLNQHHILPVVRKQNKQMISFFLFSFLALAGS